MSLLRVAGLSLLVFVADVSQAQTLTYFRVRGVIWGIAAGPDGNLWFPTGQGIAKMTPSGLMTTYPTPTAMTVGRSMITTGPDGRMWFTTRDHIGAITMDGVVTEYLLPPQTFPTGITAGADGRIWFGCTGAVARITTAGQVTLFSTGHPHSQVLDVVEGPDGNVWFVEFPENFVGWITPAGVISEFGLNGGAVSIDRGHDGGLWLAFNQGSAVARLSTNGSVSYVSTGRSAQVVSDGPGARIWFGTERLGIGSTAAIGRISDSGDVQIFDLPAQVPTVMDMVAGPDGNMWATLYPPSVDCPSLSCPPPDPTPPPGIVRVNLVDPLAVPALSDGVLVLMAMALAVIALVWLRS